MSNLSIIDGEVQYLLNPGQISFPWVFAGLTYSSFFEDEFHKNFVEWLTLVEGCLALTKALRLLERPSHLTQKTARPERCSAKDNKKTGQKTTMADKVLRHVLKANFFLHLYNTTPFPLLNVGFPVCRICLFPVQQWKGGGGLALILNRIWKRISDMMQLVLDSVNCLNYFCCSL